MKQLDWKPNRFSSVPLHKQIKEFIKNKILHGEWTVGTKLPSQRILANAFEVNRSTVVNALEELAALGLIEGKTGGGTKVINTTWSMLAAAAPTDWNSYVQAGIHPPNMTTIQEINRAEFQPGIIRLGTGELSPDLLPYNEMPQLFGRLSDRMLSLGYEEPKGNFFLRQQIATRVQQAGIQASPSSILIVSGALQALQLISIGLLRRGSTVLTESPSYLHSLHLFQSAGMKLHGVPMDQQGIRAQAIAAYKKQYKGAILYTIPSFHNPTGIVMSEGRRKDVLQVCEDERLPLIEDDVYRDLWMDAPPPAPLKANDRNGNVLYIGSMSKSVSPGLRIGWIIGPEPVIDRLADIKMQVDYGSSSLSQWAAGEWLASGLYERQLYMIRKQLAIRRNAAIQALTNDFQDVASWDVPTGGFYIWLRLQEPVPMRELFETALQEGVLLNPGHLYDRNASQSIRLSYSYASLEEIETGIRKLFCIMQKLTKKYR